MCHHTAQVVSHRSAVSLFHAAISVSSLVVGKLLHSCNGAGMSCL